MKRMLKLGFLLLGLLSQTVLAQNEEVDLRDLMTAREFQESGLHKLDIGELNALNQWLGTVLEDGNLATHVPAGESAAGSLVALAPPSDGATTSRITRPEADEFGRDRMRGDWKKKNDSQVLQAHIKGDFTGWKGGTQFELDNGQIWEQAESGEYYYPLKNPEVIISKSGVLGNYRMQILETGRIINVRRVK
ncbi:MAG: hypothetical protein V3T39_02655 [Gammaproteobacteria bacterium]